jgi:hypothetical protein
LLISLGFPSLKAFRIERDIFSNDLDENPNHFSLREGVLFWLTLPEGGWHAVQLTADSAKTRPSLPEDANYRKWTDD